MTDSPQANDPQANDPNADFATDSETLPTELARQLQQDGNRVLADVFATHRDQLWHLVTFRMDRRMMSRVDADDVLQEAYLGACDRLKHYLAKPSCSLFVWIRSLVCQTLIDVHRRHLGAEMRSAGREVSLGGPRFPQSTSVSLAGQLVGDVTSPSGVVARDETYSELLKAIESIPALDQEMIALRHFEGLANNEAAEVLGLSITAASNRYVRALKRLKQVLDSVQNSGTHGATGSNEIETRTGEDA